MTLNLWFGKLYDFSILLKTDKYINSVLERVTALKYKIDEDADIDYIKKELDERKINFIIE